MCQSPMEDSQLNGGQGVSLPSCWQSNGSCPALLPLERARPCAHQSQKKGIACLACCPQCWDLAKSVCWA